MLGVLCALSVSELDSSLSMKQSSLLTTFSPMHSAFENRLAVDLGSKPYSQIILMHVRMNEVCGYETVHANRKHIKTHV